MQETYIFRLNTDVFTELFHSFRPHNLIRTFKIKQKPDGNLSNIRHSQGLHSTRLQLDCIQAVFKNTELHYEVAFMLAPFHPLQRGVVYVKYEGTLWTKSKPNPELACCALPPHHSRQAILCMWVLKGLHQASHWHSSAPVTVAVNCF